MCDEPHIRLVDQRRGLEHMSGRFTTEVRARESAELRVDDRHQAVECIALAGVDLTEQRRNVDRRPVQDSLAYRAAGAPKYCGSHAFVAVSVFYHIVRRLDCRDEYRFGAGELLNPPSCREGRFFSGIWFEHSTSESIPRWWPKPSCTGRPVHKVPSGL
jgi:hypothetical protein